MLDLINAFAQANTPTQSALLLQDLLTENEIANLAKRLRIAKLLLSGKTHHQIVKEVNCSFATVTKVRDWLDNAGEGLRHVISQLPQRRNVYRPRRIPGVGYDIYQILLHYASSQLKKSEKQKLAKFLENMRVKAADDRDFREKTNLEFARNKKSKII